MLRKDNSKVYATIEFPDGDAVLIEAPKKQEAQLRKFVLGANRIAAATP